MSEKTALVTNVRDYVGPPAVDALVAAGFKVTAHDPSFEDSSLRQAYAEAHPGVTPVDVQTPDALIRRMTENGGTIDVLVSNDTYPAIHGPIESADIDDLRKTIDAVVMFPFALMQAAIPVFKKQGRGNIILITSCRTELPMPGGAIPDIARAGANALVKSLSLDLAPHNVPVNAVAPNYLYSEAYFPKAKFIDDPRGKAFIRDVVPAGRLGQPEEIGETIRYLAEMKGAFHTGTIIKFAGGWPAAPVRPV
ncbi:MAG: SDR family oxidoreductase [Desulfobacterales bacterium]|nr:SDR family oxidoreductase [Desulfobacterales bacterium]